MSKLFYSLYINALNNRLGFEKNLRLEKLTYTKHAKH